MYTTQREGTIARKAMPLEAYVVDWLKPDNKPATSSYSHRSRNCQGCQQTANTPELNQPSIIAGCIGGCGR